ncbi:hypothetical protein BDQ94DRAFT_150173 [Aspergillus welwitschiae]|uniref:Uncharacterized protein n=1 Tax=Aspergillus welwitschiae TaxID=1341132 RepID=A0A3F3PRU0_9EURO|nr:hypothetical protein BDQ94DRAFT_150173 [Aspergillus welwitschiae]RDH29655.1 hypothetical protein BDQ94DRAFT_150173 [Aspergillus welwitschiae]
MTFFDRSRNPFSVFSLVAIMQNAYCWVGIPHVSPVSMHCYVGSTSGVSRYVGT